MLALLSTFVFSLTANAATLISCHDGDTCKFLDGQRTVNVRFAGIDAPEAKQTGGKDARKFLLVLLANKNVQLKCDGKKSYKRKVCGVFVDGKDVAAEMVRAGWAWDVPKYSKRKYEKLMLAAQASRVGIWRNGVAGVLNPMCARARGKKSPLCRAPAGI